MQNVTVTSVISTTPTASEQSTTGTRQTTVEMNINVPYKNEQITRYYTLYICWCYIKIQMQALKVVLSITSKNTGGREPTLSRDFQAILKMVKMVGRVTNPSIT